MLSTLEFEHFDEGFLEASERWQQDTEICELIDAAPFSKQDQLKWYASLAGRNDYRIWGVSLDGLPVGAVGLKAIGQDAAEYFGYLGEKSCWGKGLGIQMLEYAENQARAMGIKVLRLRVLNHNTRAIRLYQKANYHFCMNLEPNSVIMIKFLHSNPSTKS